MKIYTHPWKNFANKLRLVLHACEILFSGIVCTTHAMQPNRARIAWNRESMASAQVSAVPVLDCTRSPKSPNPCPSHILWYTEEPLRDLSAFQRDLVYLRRVHPRVLQINGVKGIDSLDGFVNCKQNAFEKQFTLLSCEETSEVSITIGHNV